MCWFFFSSVQFFCWSVILTGFVGGCGKHLTVLLSYFHFPSSALAVSDKTTKTNLLLVSSTFPSFSFIKLRNSCQNSKAVFAPSQFYPNQGGFFDFYKAYYFFLPASSSLVPSCCFSPNHPPLFPSFIWVPSSFTVTLLLLPQT